MNLTMNAHNVDNIWQGLGYFGMGAAAGAAGAAIGAAIGGIASLGEGFISGAISGAAGGFAGGFTGSALNTWACGGSFETGLTNGLKSGMTGAGMGALQGGLISGINAWGDGRNPITGIKASFYRPSSPTRSIDWHEATSEILADRIMKEYSVGIGDYGIGKITIEPYNNKWVNIRMRLGPDGNFLQWNGMRWESLAGYHIARGSYGDFIGVSPAATTAGRVDFRATAGHEIGHSVHHFSFKTSYNLRASERVMYEYSANQYYRAGDMSRAMQEIQMGTRLGYFNNPAPAEYYRVLPSSLTMLPIQTPYLYR